MTIRNRIHAIKAKPKHRKPVECRSEAEAAAVKRAWAMEDAIRTLDARVTFLAEQLDRLAAATKRTR